VVSGIYQTNIGTAGATSLVLQTIYLPLNFASKPSKIVLDGGTHVPFAPTYDWLANHWLKYIKMIGFEIHLEINSAGFYPQGGGKIFAKINPVKDLSGITILDRGTLNRVRGISAVANLNRNIAVRQREQVIRRLGTKVPLSEIRIKQLTSNFKGTSLILICEFENSQWCYSALGAPGKPAEKVADEVCDQIEKYIPEQAAFDEYLSDQLMLPLSYANSISKFTTVRITEHQRTNAEIIKAFMNTNIEIDGITGSPGTIKIIPNSK
jgi:RNA 3'-terminal phosphate cyclase (ATP)